MESLELFEVGWLGWENEIAELFVTRRPQLHGNVYFLTFANVTRNYFPRACRSQEEQDKDAIEWASYLLNNEFEARKAFNIYE